MKNEFNQNDENVCPSADDSFDPSLIDSKFGFELEKARIDFCAFSKNYLPVYEAGLSHDISFKE